MTQNTASLRARYKRPVPILSGSNPLKRVVTFCVPLFLLFISSSVFAQSGYVEYLQDARVDTLVNRYALANQKQSSIEGYRIQITAGTNRTNVYQTKSQFYTAFPDIKQYVIYQSPNFKLRVGNYRTRLEAYKDLQNIMPRFNGSFIIRDEIKLSEL